MVFQHPSTLKKPSEPHDVDQPAGLSELDSVLTERPQFSRQKDAPQPQVIPTLPPVRTRTQPSLDGVSLGAKVPDAIGGLLCN